MLTFIIVCKAPWIIEVGLVLKWIGFKHAEFADKVSIGIIHLHSVVPRVCHDNFVPTWGYSNAPWIAHLAILMSFVAKSTDELPIKRVHSNPVVVLVRNNQAIISVVTDNPCGPK